MRTPVLVILCGVSFSGKSTLAATLATPLGAEIVSLDAINGERGLWGGEGIPWQEWAETNRIARERARVALRRGAAVIVDDTTSQRFLRDGWRDLAAEEQAEAALVWVTVRASVQRERLVANRATRERGDVADDVMSEHVDGFEDPGPDEAPHLVDGDTHISGEGLDDLIAALVRGSSSRADGT